MFVLDHVPKHFPKLCAQERGQLNFTLMVTFVLVASWISGGVSERDQGQEVRDRRQAAGKR